MKVVSKVALFASLLSLTSLAAQAASTQAADQAKAQSCLNAFVDRYLPGQSPVAKINSEDNDRSLSASRHFEMELTATRDGRVIATAICKVDQGTTSITPSNLSLMAAN